MEMWSRGEGALLGKETARGRAGTAPRSRRSRSKSRTTVIVVVSGEIYWLCTHVPTLGSSEWAVEDGRCCRSNFIVDEKKARDAHPCCCECC